MFRKCRKLKKKQANELNKKQKGLIPSFTKMIPYHFGFRFHTFFFPDV